MQKSSFFFFAATFAKLPLFSRIFLQKTPLSFTWNSCKSPLFSCNFPQTPNFRRDFCKTLTFFFFLLRLLQNSHFLLPQIYAKVLFYFFFCGNLCKIPTFHCNFCKTAPLFSLSFFFFASTSAKLPLLFVCFFAASFAKQSKPEQDKTKQTHRCILFHFTVYLFICFFATTSAKPPPELHFEVQFWG